MTLRRNHLTSVRMKPKAADALAANVSRAANRGSGKRDHASVAPGEAVPHRENGRGVSPAGGNRGGSERITHHSGPQPAGLKGRETANQGTRSDSPTKSSQWHENPNRLKS